MAENIENGLADGIAPKEIAHVEPVTTKSFKPWHKPRKQWMRRNQWVKEIDTLIPHLRLDGRPLRYLSLPGEDMLDIRVLADYCSGRNLRLKCLGYDEGARDRATELEVDISRSEISSNIEPNSVVVADNLGVLKDVNSVGFKYVYDHGPFDVINLDLCGAISCVNYPDNHQVMLNLCEYQINHSREKWLLFLTTRAEYEQVNVDHLPHYLKCLKKNAEAHDTFRLRLLDISRWDVSRYTADATAAHILDGCRNKEFVKLFAAGFSKWLLQLLDSTNNSWSVEMLNSCWYRVEDNQTATSFPNMLSLVFLFSPVNMPIQDASGLANPNPQTIIDEKALAMRILEQTENLFDVDREMDSDSSVWQQFVDESAVLLRAARYATDQYAQWAEEKRIRFN